MPVLVDFESRANTAQCDLKEVGGRLYWEHPTAEPIVAVLHDTDTGQRGVWEPGDPCPVGPGDVLAAHNARGFDTHATRRLWGLEIEIDTSELARRAGLPGALDALGTRLLNLPKDKASSKWIKSLSRPSRAKKRWGQLPDLTPEVLERATSYCNSDVEIMVRGWPDLRPYLEEGVFAGWEADVLRVDRAVNDRGIQFDRELAGQLLEVDAENTARAMVETARILGDGWTAQQVREVVQSPEQFKAWTGLADAKSETVEDALLDTAQDPRVHALCHARQAVASIARGKLEAGLNRTSADGRMRDTTRYYGAHTGRWAHKGFQPGNMTRPAPQFEGWGDAEVCGACDGDAGWPDGDLMNVLLRACLVAGERKTFVVSDFSSVEARALAWAAGDTKALEVFRAFDAGVGPDPYKVAAARGVYGCDPSDVTKGQRQVGKVAELSLGYQGGPHALTSFALKMGIDLAANGVDAKTVVDGWRKLHAPIVRFWKALEQAFHTAIDGHASKVGCFEVVPSTDGAIAIFLPSGRPIVYNAVGVSLDEWPDGRPKRSAYYLGTKSGREWVYGGKLTENVIQAMCRDLMADALVRAEDAGLCPVLHVHDEIVGEVDRSAADEGLGELTHIMTTLPEWATDFPVGASGHHGVRYRK